MVDSPGGKEVGRLSLKVLPDTSDFVPKLEEFIQKVEHKLKVEIPVDLDFGEAHQELKDELRIMQGYAHLHPVDVNMEVDTADAMAHLDITLAAMQGTADLNPVNVDLDLDSGAEQAKKQIVEFGDSGSAAMGRIGTQIALWGPLIFIAAAGIAGLAPALAVVFPLFAGMAATIGVIALSLKQLQKTFKPLLSGFKNMRVAVGNALTAGLGPLVQTLATKFLPVLKTGLVAFATFMNGAIKGLLNFLNSATGLSMLNVLLVGLGPALKPFADLLPVVAEIFLRLSIQAIPALTMMGNAILSVTKSFNGLLKTGDATSVITTAMQQLGQVLVILGKLGAALLPTLISALPVIIDLLTGFGDTLAAVSIGLKPLFDMLAKHKTTVQAFGAALAVVVVGFGLLAVATTAYDAIAAASPIGVTVIAIVALAAGLIYAYKHSERFKSIVDAVGKALKTAFGNVVAFLTPVFKFIGDHFLEFAKFVILPLAPIILLVKFIISHFQQISTVIGTVVGFIRDHFKLFATIVLLPFAPFALLVKFIIDHFGTIQSIIGTVVGFIIDHFKLLATIILLPAAPILFIANFIRSNFTGIVAFLTGVWNIIKTIFTTALAIVAGIVRVNIAIIVGAFHLLTGIVAIVSAAIGAARAAVSAGLSAIAGVARGAINGVLAAVRGVSAVAGIFRAAMGSAKTAVSAGVSAIVTTAKGVVTKIKTALTFDLSGAGAKLIQSFGRGIASAAQAVYDKVKSIAGKIKSLVPGSPVKEGPLTVFNNGLTGKLLMEMFASGIQTGGVKVIDQASTIVSQMQDTFSAFTPNDLGAGFAAAADLSNVRTSFSNQVGAIVDNTTNPDDFVQQVQINWATGRGEMTKISKAESARQEFVTAANNRMGVPE